MTERVTEIADKYQRAYDVFPGAMIPVEHVLGDLRALLALDADEAMTT